MYARITPLRCEHDGFLPVGHRHGSCHHRKRPSRPRERSRAQLVAHISRPTSLPTREAQNSRPHIATTARAHSARGLQVGHSGTSVARSPQTNHSVKCATLRLDAPARHSAKQQRCSLPCTACNGGGPPKAIAKRASLNGRRFRRGRPSGQFPRIARKGQEAVDHHASFVS